MILQSPSKWQSYEVRYLYAAPQAPAAPVVDAKTAYAPIAPVQIVWHDSPEAVDAAHWKPLCDDEGITLEELQSGVAVGSDSNGEEVEMTHEQMIQSMRDMGFWGFVDTKTRTIHAWADPATPDNAIMEFLGHEIGHVTGMPDAREWEEEMRADQYGGLVKMAHSLLLTRPAAPAAPALSTEPLPVMPRAITTGLGIDDSGEEPAYCIMAAFRQEDDARYALSILSAGIEAQAAHAAPAVDALSQAARDVLAERQRQISAEGYEPEADAMYESGELARAAATYALLATGDEGWRVEDNWPWGMSTLKRAEPRRMLEKAGALILADMERIDRIAQAAAQGDA